MHSYKKNGLNIVMQMLEKNYNEGTQRQQHDCGFAEEEQKKEGGQITLRCSNLGMYIAASKW